MNTDTERLNFLAEHYQEAILHALWDAGVRMPLTLGLRSTVDFIMADATNVKVGESK